MLNNVQKADEVSASQLYDFLLTFHSRLIPLSPFSFFLLLQTHGMSSPFQEKKEIREGKGGEDRVAGQLRNPDRGLLVTAGMCREERSQFGWRRNKEIQYGILTRSGNTHIFKQTFAKAREYNTHTHTHFIWPSTSSMLLIKDHYLISCLNVNLQSTSVTG